MTLHPSINWQGQQLGRYRLVRQLGRGNTCEVWLADDTQSHHQVAVKLLPPVAATDTPYLQAFTHTARMAGALEHSNVLTLHDFGEHHIPGDKVVTYLVMPYIPEGTLQDRICNAKGPLPVEESMHYLKQAAQAIDYAYSQQIVHGDIKPTNMLLHHGQLWLADFGIAKLLASLKYQHQTFTVGLGTAEYMAPELAQGEPSSASDRYSLATIAYQLFTGQPPFRGATPYEVLLKQIREMPPAPSQLASIPQAVEEALLQGLAKRPEDRPASCEAFVNTLERRWKVQTASTASQKPPESTGSKRLGEDAQAPQLPFPATLPSAISRAQTPFPSASNTPWAPRPISLKPLEGTVTAPSAPSTPYTPLTPSPRQRELATPQPPLMSYPTGAPTAFSSPYDSYIPYQSPQGASDQPATTYGPGQEEMISTMQAQNMAEYSPCAPPPQIPMEPAQDGQLSAKQSQFPKVARRDLLISGTVAAVAVVGGGFAITTQLLNRKSEVKPKPTPTPVPGPLNLQQGVPLLNLTGHSKAVWNAAWDPSGRYLATAGEDHTIMIWDIGSYLQKASNKVQAITEPLHSIRLGNTIHSSHLCWSSDGRKLLVTPISEKMKLLDAFKEQSTPTSYVDQSQEEEYSFLRPSYNHVAWAPKANMFAASIFYKSTVSIWQAQQTTKPLKVFEYTDPDPKLAGRLKTGEVGWSVDGTMLASLTNNSNVIVWDFKTGKLLKYLVSPDRVKTDSTIFIARSAFAWSPVNPHQIISSNMDVCMVWDVRQEKAQLLLGTNDPAPLTPPQQKEGDIKWFPHTNGLAWSPNGRYIAGSYGRSASIYLWDLQDNASSPTKDGVRMQKLFFGGESGHSNAVTEVSWSSDGRYLASASYDSTVIIWKVDRS